MTEKEYAALAARHVGKSPILKNCAKAFLSGGALCLAGELLFALYLSFLDGDAARALVSITFIFAASLLTATGVMDKIAKHTGAGTLVPITGFSNAVTSAAMEYKSEGLILGTAVKMFVVAGPVIVFGVVESVLLGVVYYAVGLFVK